LARVIIIPTARVIFTVQKLNKVSWLVSDDDNLIRPGDYYNFS